MDARRRPVGVGVEIRAVGAAVLANGLMILQFELLSRQTGLYLDAEDVRAETPDGTVATALAARGRRIGAVCWAYDCAFRFVGRNLDPHTVRVRVRSLQRRPDGLSEPTVGVKGPWHFVVPIRRPAVDPLEDTPGHRLHPFEPELRSTVAYRREPEPFYDDGC